MVWESIQKTPFLSKWGQNKRKKEKLQNVFLLFRLRVLNAIVIKNSCLYTHTKSHRQRETKKKGWLSQPTYIQIANHKKYTICVWFLQLSTTVQHNSPRGDLSSKRKLEDDIRTKYLNKIRLTINPQMIQNWTWTLGLDCDNNHTLANNQTPSLTIAGKSSFLHCSQYVKMHLQCMLYTYLLCFIDNDSKDGSIA